MLSKGRYRSVAKFSELNAVKAGSQMLHDADLIYILKLAYYGKELKTALSDGFISFVFFI